MQISNNDYTIGLFIPCYVDQFYPQVAKATLELLEKQGCKVIFPVNQTCCGQPMANSGYDHLSEGCNKNFLNNFQGLDYIVCPSGSCALHIKEHLKVENKADESLKIRNNVYELTEFLVDILKVKNWGAKFPHKVGFHSSCHGQRGLHLSSMSERMLPAFSKPESLLRMVEGIQIYHTKRVDECCGFGGTFSVFEEAVSAKMGNDRVTEHEQNGVEFITGVDMSCLMHLEGILRRRKSTIQAKHIAEILNS